MAGRVLVVDDEKMIVKGLKFSLMQDYSVVDCAYDGEGNITVIESFSADDTHALGVTLGQQAKPGDVCTLVGFGSEQPYL